MTEPVRDRFGRFTKGSSGNPKGRLTRQAETHRFDIFRRGIEDEDIVKMARGAVEDLDCTDRRVAAQAREWLSKLLFPPTTQLHRVERDEQISITVTFGGPPKGALPDPNVIDGEATILDDANRNKLEGAA